MRRVREHGECGLNRYGVAHPGVLDDAGYQQQLQQQAADVHQCEVTRVETADELFDSEAAGTARLNGIRRTIADYAAEDVLTGGIHAVEQHQHQTDEQQVAIADHQRECIAPGCLPHRKTQRPRDEDLPGE